MKPQLLICFTLITSQILYAQQPIGPNGNSLYKKGSCERVSAKFVTCTYCENKELTKNCKEYWCTDDGTCTEAPMKKDNSQLVKTKVEGTKFIDLKKEDTTSTLPKGVQYINGKITIQKGYKAVFTSNRKAVAIMSNNELGLSGSFSCECSEPGVSCGISTDGGILMCEPSGSCCRLLVVIKGETGLTMEKIEKTPEKLNWKKLVFPVKNN